MKHTTLAGTLAVLAIVVLLNMAQARSAPSASASSLGPRQEVQQLHQQSGEPALTSLTVTADGTTQPLAPAFSSPVKYYTVVVDTAVTRITVSDQDAAGTLYPSVFAPVVNFSWEVAGALRGSRRVGPPAGAVLPRGSGHGGRAVLISVRASASDAPVAAALRSAARHQRSGPNDG